MWRDLKEEEIKYLDKVVVELKDKKKFHRTVMLLSYLAILLMLLFSKSFSYEYIFEIIQIIFMNPFMWIYLYIYIKVEHQINCLSQKGYTKCMDVKILSMIPEDSSKNANWFADVKVVESGDVMEKIVCYNGEKINKLIAKKGLYHEAILIDLTSQLKKEKNEKKGKSSDESDYLIYDLTNL